MPRFWDLLKTCKVSAIGLAPCRSQRWGRWPPLALNSGGFHRPSPLGWASKLLALRAEVALSN